MRGERFMKNGKTTTLYQKMALVSTALLALVVYLGMPWSRRYSIETYNMIPRLVLEAVVRPVFLFLLGYSFLWLLLCGAKTPLQFDKKISLWLRVGSIALMLVYQVFTLFPFFLTAPDWFQAMFLALSQPYQNLVQSDSFWFVLLGVAFYVGACKNPEEKEVEETAR